MAKKYRTIFIGTPEFAIPSLRALIADSDFEIIAAITQPDKKAGRKRILTPPPVKVEAEKNNIPVFQPEKIFLFLEEIKKMDPDVIVVAAYAQIVPKDMLEIPKHGCINVHGSLLPKYRGASCIQASILNGDKETGITIMKMDAGLDTGPIIHKESIEIEEHDTAGSLYGKLSKLGGKIIAPAIEGYIEGGIVPEPQDDSQSSYAPILKKDQGRIDWEKDAGYLEKFVRAMHPWPGAWTKTRSENKLLKITRVGHKILNINEHTVGQLFARNNGLAVQCGKGALEIKKMQIEGRNEMETDKFLIGHRDYVGILLK